MSAGFDETASTLTGPVCAATAETLPIVGVSKNEVKAVKRTHEEEKNRAAGDPEPEVIARLIRL